MRIQLTSHDHHLVDNATQKIVEYISERHNRNPIAFPLPNESTEDEEGFVDSTHYRVIDVWSASSELIRHLTQLQLPEGVDVSIKQSRD
jgi:ribosomal protein S10